MLSYLRLRLLYELSGGNTLHLYRYKLRKSSKLQNQQRAHSWWLSIFFMQIQPIDMVKVRIQLRSEGGGSTSPISVAKEIYGIGGMKEFYRGIDSALLR